MSLTLNQWEARLRSVSTRIGPLAHQATGATAKEVERQWKATVPVDSGDYQGSIGIEFDGIRPNEAFHTVTGGGDDSDAPYGFWVEYGGAHPPRPHARRALAESTPKFRRRAEVVGVEALTRSLT